MSHPYNTRSKKKSDIQSDVQFIRDCLYRLETTQSQPKQYLNEVFIMYLYLANHITLFRFQPIRKSITKMIKQHEDIVRQVRKKAEDVLSLHPVNTTREYTNANSMIQLTRQIDDIMIEVELELLRYR